ncbi:hypothetical protein ACVWZR_007682 [Bradyrhizobium sp. i1.3.1]
MTTAEHENKTRRSREPTHDMPLYPTEAQISRAVLGDRAKDWKRIAKVLEDKEGLPKINELMGGRFWPAVVAFFHNWHGISEDGKRITYGVHQQRIQIVPPRSQFEIEKRKEERIARERAPTPKTPETIAWEKKIKESPMWPSEKKILGLFYRARNSEKPQVEGSGEEVPQRLYARGYLSDARLPHITWPYAWRITPEGEKVWLRINAGENVKK